MVAAAEVKQEIILTSLIKWPPNCTSKLVTLSPASGNTIISISTTYASKQLIPCSIVGLHATIKLDQVQTLYQLKLFSPIYYLIQ